ncbi:hypothetical protein BCV70DRAFT_203615 [Testicularia cyperi]|uniref:Uncharacterized protein n=1 Tax=Testicularia cyperi TaxID=1882483 RepID=A0A317XWN6_9BASI|nr:hypothetical protein BCV70DRAFT_203615 [Testicularia cyperi]
MLVITPLTRESKPPSTGAVGSQLPWAVSGFRSRGLAMRVTQQHLWVLELDVHMSSQKVPVRVCLSTGQERRAKMPPLRTTHKPRNATPSRRSCACPRTLHSIPASTPSWPRFNHFVKATPSSPESLGQSYHMFCHHALYCHMDVKAVHRSG